MKVAKIEFTFKSEFRSIGKMRVDLYAAGGFETDGDWSASDQVSKKLCKLFLGKDSGYWVCEWTNRKNVVFLRDHDDPNFISFLWRDLGHSVCTFHNVGPIPFMVGRKGYGFQSAPPSHPLDWVMIAI